VAERDNALKLGMIDAAFARLGEICQVVIRLARFSNIPK
jgi:hypothetical protein